MTDESRPPMPPTDAPPHNTRSRGRAKPFFASVDASLLGLGSQMMSEVAAGVLLGLGLDYIFGTKNRWVVVGSIAGVAVAMVTVFRLALKSSPPRRLPPGTRATDLGPVSTPVAPPIAHPPNSNGGTSTVETQSRPSESTPQDHTP